MFALPCIEFAYLRERGIAHVAVAIRRAVELGVMQNDERAIACELHIHF